MFRGDDYAITPQRAGGIDLKVLITVRLIETVVN